MNQEVKKIVESGILEAYLLGFATPLQIEQVENSLKKHPELRNHYAVMETEFEKYAALYTDPVLNNSNASGINAKAQGKVPNQNMFKGITAAAVILALISSSLLFFQWKQSKDLVAEKEAISAKYTQLKTDCENQNMQYANLNQVQEILKHPATQKILLVGNERAPKLETVAFWNNVAKKAHLNIANFPALPEDHCLQLWVDIHGEMISLGVIPKEIRVIELPYKLEAESLNITIEPLGGSDSPTVSRIVSSQPLSI